MMIMMIQQYSMMGDNIRDNTTNSLPSIIISKQSSIRRYAYMPAVILLGIVSFVYIIIIVFVAITATLGSKNESGRQTGKPAAVGLSTIGPEYGTRAGSGRAR